MSQSKTQARQSLLEKLKPNQCLWEGRIRGILPPKLNQWGSKTWISRDVILNTSQELGGVQLLVLTFDDKHRGILEVLKPGVEVMMVGYAKSRLVDSGTYHDIHGIYAMASRGERGWAEVPNNAPNDMPEMTVTQRDAVATGSTKTADTSTEDEGDDLPF